MRRWNFRLGVCLAIGAVGCTGRIGDGADGSDPNGDEEQAYIECGSGKTVRGIDVSYYEGHPNWKEIASSGIKFAFARINDGGFMDPDFEYDYSAIRAHGMVRGSYQFFRSYEDPIQQANLVVDKVGKLGPGDLAPVLDVEETNGAGPGEMAQKIEAWAHHIEARTGRKPIIYTGKYFWDDNVGTGALKGLPLWHAQYTSAKCPDVANPWHHWTIWQYTDSEDVPGVGAVDGDRFNGDELQLQDLAANGYRAQIVSLSYPKSLKAGQTGEVELVLRNLGARAWGENTHLGTSDKRDRTSPFHAAGWLSDNRVATTGHVAHSKEVTLKFAIAAPSKPGNYVEHYNLVQEHTAWFSDIVPGGGPKDDAIALHIDVTP